ncbi:hypothetical protein ACIPJG_25315 [Streptomyces halstedii]|uniref:hypothetical protein n=1 Tax=Streptomyces halstedii TaxID=1944 RepID=UPI0037FCD539
MSVRVNGQTFTEGDTVHFAAATLPVNRARDYKVVATGPAGIQVTSGNFTYEYTVATAARVGITHTQEPPR